ncbi:MAG TPA: DegT/DnrJ/EryC1/StrS family aminotransferase [bacterium]|nr:DegT/DnrJ/EryC1/StrS family aminotransferase [bacterium]
MADSGTMAKLVRLPSDQDASGRTLGDEEIRALTEAIRSGVLTSTKGTFVKSFEEKFAREIGVKHAQACSSGTSAIHCAIAAVDPEPGDEIITTPITDMGALTPIVYQGAIPVFADVDPRTWNVTAQTIERCLSTKTKAIIVSHLFGNPCDMKPILALAQRKGIPVIEDCAQSFHSTVDGKQVGTLGAIGCFSLQQGKHITTGEGGIVTSNDDHFARRAFLFINKAWGYGDEKPDHYFLALNARMSELQGAVAAAQLPKLAGVVERRRTAARRLDEKLRGISGIEIPYVHPGCVHTYWKYCLRVDGAVVQGGSPALGAALKERGIASAPRYIVKPAFRCEVFRDQRTFGKSRWPFTLARPEAVDYADAKFPGTKEGLERVLVLPWNEKYTAEHVDFLAAAIKDGVARLSGARGR